MHYHQREIYRCKKVRDKEHDGISFVIFATMVKFTAVKNIAYEIL